MTEIQVVRVEISDGTHTGRGECRPYARYEETPDSVIALVEKIRPVLKPGLSRTELQHLMPAGAARNAVDCALWDLEAKQANKPTWAVAGLPQPKPCTTAYTLSIDTPANMAQAAKSAAHYPLLKMKIGPEGGIEACKAVLSARPDASLIIDANEALRPEDLPQFQAELSGQNVVLLEQPLPAAQFDAGHIDPNQLPIVCADESLHTADDLPKLWDAGYRAVNVKLDKCGGLTAGLELMTTAKDMGFTLMAGCMVGTSLAMAPMVILAHLADYVDLDGPLLLSRDVENGLRYDGAVLYPPTQDLWG